jgi:hypothetical protein
VTDKEIIVMTTSVLPRPADSQLTGRSGITWSVTLVLTGWFLLVASLAAVGAFVVPLGTPPIPIAIGVGAPLIAFLAWLRLSPAFRDFVLSLDLRFIAGIQAWRLAGLGFLSLYAHNILPGIFALPAGLGDMSVAFAAPWIILSLLRRPDFAASAAFRRWNVLGIVDLVVAVSLGTLSAIFSTGAPGEISTASLQTPPEVIIPAFLVPLFLMLHVAALMQSQQIIRSRE